MSARYTNMQETREQLQEVVSVMRNNVEKVIARDQKLGELEDMSENLRDNSVKFERDATRLKRALWWKNAKFMILLAIVIFVLILIFAIAIAKS